MESQINYLAVTKCKLDDFPVTIHNIMMVKFDKTNFGPHFRMRQTFGFLGNVNKVFVWFDKNDFLPKIKKWKTAVSSLLLFYKIFF